MVNRRKSQKLLFEEELVCRTEKETRQAARALGKVCRGGEVFALIGDLGAGKTVFAQGLAQGLGVKEYRYVSSPTFTLINEYEGRFPYYHVDLYRLGDPDELLELGLDEYLEGEGICAVEWFDHFEEDWPPETVEIGFRFDGESGRRLVVTARHPQAVELARLWIQRFRIRRQTLL